MTRGFWSFVEAKKTRRLTAQQAQKSKDNEKWEKNRMFRSGAVLRTDHDEDFEEISEAKVHLLVHNIIPPFLGELNSRVFKLNTWLMLEFHI